jgi:hypothetical protein
MDHRGIKIIIHASIWFAPVLVPLLIYLLMEDRPIRSLSIQALLFHLIMWTMIGISSLFSLILIGIPFFILFSIIGLVVPIIGIVYAIKDQPFHYPLLASFTE